MLHDRLPKIVSKSSAYIVNTSGCKPYCPKIGPQNPQIKSFHFITTQIQLRRGKFIKPAERSSKGNAKVTIATTTLLTMNRSHTEDDNPRRIYYQNFLRQTKNQLQWKSSFDTCAKMAWLRFQILIRTLVACAMLKFLRAGNFYSNGLIFSIFQFLVFAQEEKEEFTQPKHSQTFHSVSQYHQCSQLKPYGHLNGFCPITLSHDKNFLFCVNA